MKIKPTSSYVLIEQTEVPKAQTTIIITTKDTEKGLKPAKVVEVGTEAHNTREGMMIYPIWGEAKPITIDGKEMALIKEEHIIAYVTSLDESHNM